MEWSALEIARASVLGQPVHFLSPLVASTLLLVGMVKKDIGNFSVMQLNGLYFVR